jgi:hypothetical protein
MTMPGARVAVYAVRFGIPQRIEVAGREGELFRAVVVRRHRHDTGMDERDERAVIGGAERNALLGWGTAADDAVDAFAR